MMKEVTFCKHLNSCKGSTSVIIVCVTLIIILLAALLTDIGYASIQRYELKRNAEAVAKEGAEILVNGKEQAVSVIKKSAVRKVNDLNVLDIIVSDNNREVTVTMGRPFSYIFLSMLGFNTKQIKTSVTAKLSCIDSFKGLRPFAIENQAIEFNMQYVLRDMASDAKTAIQFVPVRLGNGSFETDIIYGNTKLLKVGENINPLSGDISTSAENGIGYLIRNCNHEPKCTYRQYVKDCSRIIVVPVVDRLDLTGSSVMKITGFTTFFIESYNVSNGHTMITGRFIKYTVNSSTNDGAGDFGLLGVRVIR